jgi:predicted ABC-type ATPase
MMSDEEFLRSIEELLDLGSGATDEEIEQNAFEFIKSQKHHLPNKFLSYRNQDKKAIFMAGGSGVGKSETALNISKNEKIDIVDTDDIRKICPLYSGQNSHLFQKASSRGVSILLDYIFKHNFSFILDGNFAEYAIQKENIERALKRGYKIEIIFVYRDKEVAKEYTKQREKVEGRVVPDNVFETKYKDSILTTKKILNEYDDLSFKFIDLSSREILKDQDAKERLENNL